MIARLAGIQKDTIVDGPGIRISLYFQGCSHCCPGCHNPETHDPTGGSNFSTDELLSLVDNCPGIDGVTLSGGEPFEQAASAAVLAAAIRDRKLNLVLYSGYYFEELMAKSLKDHNVSNLLKAGWLLVDGPFIEEEKDLTLAFRGSRNQRLIDLPRSLEASEPITYAKKNH